MRQLSCLERLNVQIKFTVEIVLPSAASDASTNTAQQQFNIQQLQKIFRPQHVLHTEFSCRFNFKLINLPFLLINLHSVTLKCKVKTCF